MMQAAKSKGVPGLVLLMSLLVCGRPAMADSTADLLIQATVEGACKVSGNTLNFGNYDPDDDEPKMVSVPISYNCDTLSNIAISLDPGGSGNPSERAMFNSKAPQGQNHLKYQLYQDEGREILWGIFSKDTMVIPETKLGDQGLMVYGKIFPKQTVAPGTFTDTVQITLTMN